MIGRMVLRGLLILVDAQKRGVALAVKPAKNVPTDHPCNVLHSLQLLGRNKSMSTRVR